MTRASSFFFILIYCSSLGAMSLQENTPCKSIIPFTLDDTYRVRKIENLPKDATGLIFLKDDTVRGFSLSLKKTLNLNPDLTLENILHNNLKGFSIDTKTEKNCSYWIGIK